MAIKKSELYSSLWSSCDELRGGMDASQYKDYVLVMLFVKYVSDKYAGQPFAPINIPQGASFKDMVALKGKPTIGDDINKKIIAPLANANKLSSMPDFNDPEKLGSGKDMVDRLTNLIAIFENKALDFSKNRAEGDDILGDAYEYLMRHFATESGKSKGQFYTPAEVSRIMARVIAIDQAETTASTTVYDPTCGSGSLLLKVADAAKTKVSLYGQEKDAATSGLARMNMILHDNPGAEIKQGNTLANPLFLYEQGGLKTFDYVVANPPFSDKRWGNGVETTNDPHQRFNEFGVPPDKNGDYAYLLHIIRSLKSRGKGACILPHGVLFRGNVEADIRKAIIRKGLIKGIIGLPANLFYGTGIPACIIVIDKENAQNRKGIFMIDAGKGFMKDGNKNRLREMDIHKIVDVFNKQTEIQGYSKIVSFGEIEKNEFNLNIPRYIDSAEAEDLQDIEAHLLGDIPKADIDALQDYWAVCPSLKSALFAQAKRSPNYLSLKISKDEIKPTIFAHPEFTAYMAEMNQVFGQWEKNTTAMLKALQLVFHPKDIIHKISEALLATYEGRALIDRYDVYQHLMNYWSDVMQDDCYLIAGDGWQATTYRIVEEKKNKDGQPTKTVDKGWTCDLIPKTLVIQRYFSSQQQAIDTLNTKKRQIKQGAMQTLLTGEKRLPMFVNSMNYQNTDIGIIPEDWDCVAMGDIGQSLIGLTYNPSNVKDYGTLVLRSSNVQGDQLAFENNVFVDMELPKRVMVEPDDILICVRNGSRQLIGKCALIDDRVKGAAFGAFMSVYRSKYSRFIFYQFQSHIIQKQIEELMGATINQITNKDLSVFKVVLPKNEEEQTCIATILSDMDTEIAALETKLAKYRHIKQGMMQSLLTGRIRLI